MAEAELAAQTEEQLKYSPVWEGARRPVGRRIGFVSTRLSGTDGVSLETRKWAEVLGEAGHECFYFAGACEQPAEQSCTVAEAAFDHGRSERSGCHLGDRRYRR